MILRGITGEIAEKTEHSLKKAERRTSNLLTIIDEMIDYAYMRSESESRYRWTEIQLDRTLVEIVDLHITHAQQRKISIRVDCQPGLTFVSNRDLLNILLGNLINNAIKYSPEDTTIVVSALRDGADVKFQVQDQGYGIEADQLEQIFEEFYRTRHARELERDGTGLGLPIVQRAVESLGGRIRVYSELDRGTRFDIWLPFQTGAPDNTSNGEEDETNSHH
jgi:signal transduction histidine kinase